MIPQVAHFFWANSTMSLMRFLTLASFRHWNPTWKIVLHRPNFQCKPQSWKTPERQEFYGEPATDNWMDKVSSLDIEIVEWKSPRDDLPVVHASDLFAWQILATEGGLYCDMDILFVQPIANGLGEDKLDRDAWLCFYLDVFPIGFMSSVPNNPFFLDIYEFCSQRPLGSSYQTLGCEAGIARIHRLPTFINNGYINLPKSRHRAIQQHYEQRVLLLGQGVVYPWGPEQLRRIFSEQHPRLNDRTLGIHWYGGHPMAQEANATMTRDRLTDETSTFAYFARKVPLP